jgi:hypothetical protein
MKKQHAYFTIMILAALGTAMIPIVTSCFGEPAEEQTLEELLRWGRRYLEDNKGSIAYTYFEEALEIDPNNTDAQYGIVLALGLRVFAEVDGTIDLLAGVVIENPARTDCEKACARVEECGLLDELWTEKENCVSDCPFGLQPDMFETLIDGSSCYHIRDEGIQWITATTQEDCNAICDDLEFCGVLRPPVTFDLQECKDHCPYSYVERHSKCYVEHIGHCDGEDRTCFEHVTVGLQILFRDIGMHLAPQIIEVSDKLLEKPYESDQYFLRRYSWTLFDPPLDWDLDGRYTHGYLHLVRTLGHGWQFILTGATSVYLEMNFPSFDINFNYGDPQGIEEIFDALIRVLEILMYDPIFPNGFQIYDEPWAFESIKQAGLELGSTFGSLADLLDFAMNDTDRQEGLGIGYTDDNHNFTWDPGEVMEFRGLGFSITYEQAIELIDLCRAFEANLHERIPFKVEVLNEFLEVTPLGSLTLITDLLAAWSEDGMVDISKPFYEPEINSVRNLVTTLIDKLIIIRELL